MRSRLLILAATIAVLMLAPARATAFGVNDVLKLQHEQVSDSLIVLAIQKSGQVIHVSSDDFRRLKQAGVSDDVMSAILRSEQAGFQKNAAAHDGVAPGVYVHYPYGPPPYARSSFAFSFSYGYPWPVYGPRFGFYRPYPFRRW